MVYMPARLAETFGMRVLVVEDDRKTGAFIQKALKSEGFAVDLLRDGDEGLRALLATPFDAAVIDIMLPGRDGLSIVRQLRGRNNTTPILLLSARGEVNERVEGLDAGADDYLPKPFALAELTARLRALVRRGGETKSNVLRIGALQLDIVSRTATRGDRRIELSNREFQLLEYLMRSPGRICTRMMIIEKVWGYDFDPGSNVIEVYIRKLREKVDAEGEPKLLHTVRGAGYTMREP
jgi:DNA-binding response OmpR family regulator